MSLHSKIFVSVCAVFFSWGGHAAEKKGDLLRCSLVGEVLDFSDFRGQTYLSFMQDTIKPEMDGYALEGYSVASVENVLAAFDNVSKGVQRKILTIIPGRKISREEKLAKLSDLMEQIQGKKTTMYELPKAIRNANSAFRKPYKLATFIGLASCAGPTIRFHDDNYAYNVHYGTGAIEKDDRTGRSFGAGPTRKAEDASDKNYLLDLEEYIVGHSSNTSAFYETLLTTLLDSNADNYPSIESSGQTVLTDFLAVYTAEQARNLMDNKIKPHWDASLLEITLLGAFHSGQETVKLVYVNPFDGQEYFVSKTFKQTTGCDLNAIKIGEEKLPKIKNAGMVDYWQFSYQSTKEHCSRSGLNVSKSYRSLGKHITAFMAKQEPDLLERIRKQLKGTRKNANLFRQFSLFLINEETPRQIPDSEVQSLSADLLVFLEKVQQYAPEITTELEAVYKQPLDFAPLLSKDSVVSQ